MCIRLFRLVMLFFGRGGLMRFSVFSCELGCNDVVILDVFVFVRLVSSWNVFWLCVIL